MSRLRAILVLFVLLAAGALTTACKTTGSGNSGGDYQFINNRGDP